jgi:hypothetical protein
MCHILMFLINTGARLNEALTMRYAHLSAKALQEAANAGWVIMPKVAPKTGGEEATKAA